MGKTFAQRQLHAEQSLDNYSHSLFLAIRHIATEHSIAETAVTSDSGRTLKILQDSLDLESNSGLDILFIKNLDNTVLVDASSPFFDLQTVVPAIAESDLLSGNSAQLFTFPAEQSELVVIITSFTLIQQKTGRIVGTLIGGSVLNGDITLVEKIRKKIQVDSLVLLVAGQIIASTRSTDTSYIREAIGNLPVVSHEFRELADGYLAYYKTVQRGTESSALEFVLIVQDTILTDLKAAYQDKFILLIYFFIGFSFLILFLVKRLITVPLKNLFLYITRIVHGEQEKYKVGPIFEFNQIGTVMGATIRDLQQSSSQLREEIAKRQQVAEKLEEHRNTLEQTVALRTRELNEINETLITRNRELLREKLERKLAQEENLQLAEAVKNSLVSIVITDQHGTIEYVNPKFFELTQYSAEEAIGQNPRFLSSGLLSDKYYKKLWDTILAGQEWFGEFCNRKKDGEKFWEMASISPIFDAEGKIRYFVAVKEDITNRASCKIEKTTICNVMT